LENWHRLSFSFLKSFVKMICKKCQLRQFHFFDIFAYIFLFYISFFNSRLLKTTNPCKWTLWMFLKQLCWKFSMYLGLWSRIWAWSQDLNAMSSKSWCFRLECSILRFHLHSDMPYNCGWNEQTGQGSNKVEQDRF